MESVGDRDKSHVSNHICSCVNFKMLYVDSSFKQIKQEENIWKEIHINYPGYVYNDVKKALRFYLFISNRYNLIIIIIDI